MPMRRFTILGLMGLILGVAVAVAALRNADDYWAGGLMLATLLLIGVVTLSAVYHSGRRRAGRLGFVVFAGGYFALSFLGLPDQQREFLPTTWLLSYVHERVAPPQTITISGTVVNMPTSKTRVWVSNTNPAPLRIVTARPAAPAPANPVISADRWKSMLPGAANYEAFSIVGHCLFALLAGLLGMVIARWYQARQERVVETGPVDA